MRDKLLVALAVGGMLAIFASGAAAGGFDLEETWAGEDGPACDGAVHGSSEGLRGGRLETLWIYSADFEDPNAPENQWISLDRSGTLGQDNFWHKDTIRIRNFTHLGDSTWWCGTYNVCWCQPRGYGNSWIQYLERDFELGTWSSTGETVELEFDQRYAMEHDYDYGYIDVSTDGGDTWMTIQSYTNPGFAGKPGTPKDWDSDKGHQRLDLSTYAGQDVRLRFRFESDDYYSAQDEYDNLAHSVKDGAWQFDNVEWNVWKPDSTQVWYDDAEAPGDNGWVHEDLVASGQVGLKFWRGLYKTDFNTGRPFTCGDREGWMYTCVDSWTNKMIDNENTWIISPPIDISGAPKLVGNWDYWGDAPRESGDLYDLWLASNDLKSCVQDPAGFVDEAPGAWYASPGWRNRYDDWDAFAGNDWFAINIRCWNSEPPPDPGLHMAGLILNYAKLGVPSGDPGTAWNYGVWDRFNDWFKEQLADALLDTAIINIKDDDDIASANMLASNDGGTTWSAYPMLRPSPFGNDWYAPPPAAELTAGSEIWYYFEAIDGVGNTSVYPSAAPSSYYEISILPLEATVSDPGILLVDKFGRVTPGEDRNYRHYAEYYYTEMLEILGYEWEVYDVEVPSGSTDQSDGPDTCGYKYYDTQIWFTNYFDAYTIKPPDQVNIIAWLSQSPDKERNLLLTGNDIGYELKQAGKETLSFYDTWLASNYLENTVGEVLVDSCPRLQDVSGFMTYDDGQCMLRGGCPNLHYFDVVQPYPGMSGTLLPVEYKLMDNSTKPAGCAFTNQTSGYQTVNLGFGMEFMMDSMYVGPRGMKTGYYITGIADRVDLMGNIMEYFEKDPTLPGTDVPYGEFRNKLSYAYPNPFNPVTAIAYSVREPGPVAIRVYNVAGKVVRTLLDEELDAGASGQVVWDGLNDARGKCASGVYFYRIEAPGFATTRKMVMLK